MENVDWQTVLWVGSTLLGTVIGAFFSWLSTNTVEKLRARSERDNRFQADRKLLYIKLLRTATELSSVHAYVEPVTAPQKMEILNLISEVEVMASLETRKPALDLIEVINDRLSGHKEVSMETWTASRNSFIAAVHRELDIAIRDEPPLIPESTSPGIAASWSKLKAQSQMPLPFVTGAVGLLMAFAVKDGLSGGQGFVIGFLLGVILIAVAAWQIEKQHS